MIAMMMLILPIIIILGIVVTVYAIRKAIKRRDLVEEYLEVEIERKKNSL